MESQTESQTESQSEQTGFLNPISQRLLQRDVQLNKKLEALPAAQDAANHQDAANQQDIDLTDCPAAPTHEVTNIDNQQDAQFEPPIPGE